MKKRSLKIAVTVVSLVLVFAVMSFGFAAWTDTITVNGYASAVGSWDVSIDSVETESDGSSYVIADDGKSVDVTLRALEFPGDYETFMVAVTNNGTVPAALTTATPVIDSEDSDLKFAIEYPVAGDDVIDPGDTCHFTIVAYVDKEFSASDLDISNSFTFTLGYEADVEAYTTTPSATHY